MPTRMFAGSFFLIHSGSVLCRDLREAPEHPRSARKRPFGPSAAVYSSLDGETFSSYPLLLPLTENACGWRGWPPQACRG